jgi:hypothetical protein
LRVTPEANAQGKNRYERAAYDQRKLRSVNAHTRWELIDVRADHDQKKMAPDRSETAPQILEKASERGGRKFQHPATK